MNQKVTKHILKYPIGQEPNLAKPANFSPYRFLLGKQGEHNTEIHAILAEYGLPSDFPIDVETYAQHLDTSITAEEIAKRRDMRDVLTFTIDPRDAKDFDDALSFQQLENGNYEIGVHIADVSHFGIKHFFKCYALNFLIVFNIYFLLILFLN